MIDYRFLLPAELEMTDAALFYDNVCPGLGTNFLDEVNHVIGTGRKYPLIGELIE